MPRKFSKLTFAKTVPATALLVASLVGTASCSSDALKFKRDSTADAPPPSSAVSSSPVADSSESTSPASPALVDGVDNPEAVAARNARAADAPSETGAGFYSPEPLDARPGAPESDVPVLAPTSGATGTPVSTRLSSTPTSPPDFESNADVAPLVEQGEIAPTDSLPLDAIEARESTRLREELIAARADVKRQLDANETLLRQNALYRRDAEDAVAELRRENAELVEKNRSLLANAAEEENERAFRERRLRLQSAALRDSPTVVVVPNNSAAEIDLRPSDPKILPVRRDGDSTIVELQDDLLFDANALLLPVGSSDYRLSPEGQNRLRVLATEILRRYPTNVLAIGGHSDADPARPDDGLTVQAATVRKARAVAKFLIAETGVAPNQTTVAGAGAALPIVSNETATNRRRNRRVEITIRPEVVVPRFEPPRIAAASVSQSASTPVPSGATVSTVSTGSTKIDSTNANSANGSAAKRESSPAETTEKNPSFAAPKKSL